MTTTETMLLEALEGLMHWHPHSDTIRRMGLNPAPAEAAWDAARRAITTAKKEDRT